VQAPRSAAAPSSVGPLPDALRALRWPEPPRVTREIELPSSVDAIRTPGTRARVRGARPRLVVEADDVELLLDEHAFIAQLALARGVSRVRVSGGRLGAVELPVPAQHHPPPPVWRAEWMAQDVRIEDVEIDASDSALMLRGRRIAVLRSRVRAVRYAVWCGDTEAFASEDLILAGNRFASAGPEATVRLVSVRRAVVVDNVLENTFKHDFRVHGHSELVFFGRNRLIETGIMIGTMDGDRVDRVWLEQNVLHHRAPSLLEVDPERVRRLTVRGNRVFTDVWSCFVCNPLAPDWHVEDDEVAHYRPAPPEAPRAPGASR
jgi:hypothetical protein